MIHNTGFMMPFSHNIETEDNLLIISKTKTKNTYILYQIKESL